ncbi:MULTISPECIES: metallophosphoesterase family protein [Nocardioides]|uniref:metallophosphoesterase family protein n=1 Tax=Nocardioides TaxID=1839 RepID=UPI00032FACED|nr:MULTISPECIES: metallophosphoesterase [Nocardioides]EON22069.1 hypothetical protein CF8_4068 [Nocardioides sp. CF8]
MLTRRRTLIGVTMIATLAAFAAAVLLIGFDRSADLPSPVTGDKVPALTRPPLVRVAVAGDTGTGDSAEEATAEQMTEQAQANGGPYDALLLLGDLIYEDGEVDLVDDAVTDPFAALLENGTTLVPVLGNHDYISGEQTQILGTLGRDTTWYATRIGQLRLVVLDTEHTDDPSQTAWLEDTLGTPQPPGTWTVVAMHKPAYSAGYHGSDEEVQRLWAPLFDKYDVPLVLAGHDHDYQRSKAINGVTYVVSGAGAKLRPTGHEDFTAVSASTLHFVDMLVYSDRIVLRAIDQDGMLVDMFTLRR